MIEINVSDIKELEDQISNIRLELKNNSAGEHARTPEILFRGQSDSSWELDTTLERYTKKPYSVLTYNRLLRLVNPAVESFLGKKWVIDSQQEDLEEPFFYPPSYEFMVYARHHGFPSPLLDWTKSLYVAIFFAFQKSTTENKVSLFLYIERPKGMKMRSLGFEDPMIVKTGDYVASHKRHFIQQGQYTISVKRGITGLWEYCSHEESLRASEGKEQDIIYKFNIPSNLKVEVLNKLNEMNINSYTLYGNEESLMEKLAFHEIYAEDL